MRKSSRPRDFSHLEGGLVLDENAGKSTITDMNPGPKFRPKERGIIPNANKTNSFCACLVRLVGIMPCDFGSLEGGLVLNLPPKGGIAQKAFPEKGNASFTNKLIHKKGTYTDLTYNTKPPCQVSGGRHLYL